MSPRHAPRLVALVTAVIGALCSAAIPAAASPVFGFVEEWPGTSTQSWGGGAFGAVYSNPGTGGVLGSGDGYLLVTQAVDGNFGTRSMSSDYSGDFLAAGIEMIRVSLDDVGAADAFEIHVAIGNGGNLWQYNVPFVPPHDAWAEFNVDLYDTANYTQIIGSDTFENALRHADRILIRNDSAPFLMGPDPAHGDLGIDHLVFGARGVPTQRTTWGKIKALYR